MELALSLLAVFVLAIAIPVVVKKLWPNKGKEPDVHKGNPYADPKLENLNLNQNQINKRVTYTKSRN